MEWISVKENLPKGDGMVILLHTVYGVGFGNIYLLDKDNIQIIEEEMRDKYICSFYFVKSVLDGNHQLDILGGVDGYNDEDVFENSPHFKNLGTITHWMSLPLETQLGGYK